MSKDSLPKRVKVTLACTICRKKKVKCDGVQPTCSRCSTIGMTCQYADPPKKRGPPKGYVEVIENRAHRIESLLIHQPTIEAPIVNQQLTKHIIINPIVDLITNAVLEKTANEFYLHGSNGILYDFLMSQHVLEKEHIVSIWVHHFFTYFNHLFPLLSRPHFILEFQETSPILKLAVYLLGCRLTNDTNCIDLEKSLYQEYNVLSHDTFIADLTLTQANVIMCWYAYLAGDLQTCYSLRYTVATLIQKLDFGHGDIHSLEMKRRTFWVAYVMEQWLACCTGGDRYLSRIGCKYPQLEDAQLVALSHHHQATDCFSLESALQICVFQEMIQLADILADFCDGCSPSLLSARLTSWLLQLPPYLDYGNEAPSSIAKIYRMLYYTVQIMLNKGQNNQLSTSICTTAANTIVHMAEKMELYEKKYLYNFYFSSLVLAMFIHLNTTSLSKSMSLIKDVNCTLLAREEIEPLLYPILQPPLSLEDMFSIDYLDLFETSTCSSHSIEKEELVKTFQIL